MKPILCLLSAVCVAPYVDSLALTAQEPKPKPALSLKLEAAKETIRAGTEPILRLTIENTGKADERILKPRGDLQDHIMI